MTIHRLTLIAFVAGVTASFFGGTFGLWAANSVTAVRTEPVFVYASLENDVIRSYACQCFTKPQGAQIKDFTVQNDSIRDMKGGTVRGEVVLFSQEEFARVDSFIGFPETHYRITVMVGEVPVWTYVRRGSGTATRPTASTTSELSE